MKLYFSPISSYSQKTLTAFHEKGVAFTPEVVEFSSPESISAYRELYPLGKVPFLVLDNG